MNVNDLQNPAYFSTQLFKKTYGIRKSNKLGFFECHPSKKQQSKGLKQLSDDAINDILYDLVQPPLLPSLTSMKAHMDLLLQFNKLKQIHENQLHIYSKQNQQIFLQNQVRQTIFQCSQTPEINKQPFNELKQELAKNSLQIPSKSLLAATCFITNKPSTSKVIILNKGHKLYSATLPLLFHTLNNKLPQRKIDDALTQYLASTSTHGCVF